MGKCERCSIVSIRIDALSHTRQLIIFSIGILTIISSVSISSLTSTNSELFINQIFPFGKTALNVSLIALGAVEVSFIMAVFLLTDAIHHYSKSIEYVELGEVSKTEKRAVAADDVSYFFVRIGLFALIFVVIWVLMQLLFYPKESCNCFQILTSIISVTLAFLLVWFGYHVSHHPKTYCESAIDYFRFWGWKKAVENHDRHRRGG